MAKGELFLVGLALADTVDAIDRVLLTQRVSHSEPGGSRRGRRGAG
jgi:hypothetical protein